MPSYGYDSLFYRKADVYTLPNIFINFLPPPPPPSFVRFCTGIWPIFLIVIQEEGCTLCEEVSGGALTLLPLFIFRHHYQHPPPPSSLFFCPTLHPDFCCKIKNHCDSSGLFVLFKPLRIFPIWLNPFGVTLQGWNKPRFYYFSLRLRWLLVMQSASAVIRSSCPRPLLWLFGLFAVLTPPHLPVVSLAPGNFLTPLFLQTLSRLLLVRFPLHLTVVGPYLSYPYTRRQDFSPF